MNQAQLLRNHGLEIVRAGIEAVNPSRLVQNAVTARGNTLKICGREHTLAQTGRVIVVGAGKAAAGMAEGLEAALDGTPLFDRLSGQVQIPQGVTSSLQKIVPLAVRPVGVNEPTHEAVAATRAAVQLMEATTPDDLIVLLLSGGASALLTWPPEEIGLETKVNLTRYLSRAGASIEELNSVRSQMSRVKGGSLLNNGRAPVVTLVISDVIGDPPHLIGSGPTVVPVDGPDRALEILKQYAVDQRPEFRTVLMYLETLCMRDDKIFQRRTDVKSEYHLIGSIRTAMQAAGECAERLGYQTDVVEDELIEGDASLVGQRLVDRVTSFSQSTPMCWIYGGETTVKVPNDGLSHQGGRNQQVALAALVAAQSLGLENTLLMSVGTDGEDGPTDAAGGMADQLALERARELGLDLESSLESCNAYRALSQIDALMRTGPTGTNVMDLLIVLNRSQST